MKKTTRFEVLLLVVISLVVMLFTTSCNASIGKYDESILKTAKATMQKEGFWFDTYNPFKTGEMSFEIVSKTDTEDATDYLIEIDGMETSIKLYTVVDYFRHATKDIKEIRNEFIDIVNNSKKLICDYIDESTILVDKEKLKKEINETPFKEATNVSKDDEVKFSCAWFDHMDGIVYISGTADPELVCEETIVHELIHALDYYTHNCSPDISRSATLFSEAITDLIAESLNPPKNKKGYISAYEQYYGAVSPYINLLGEDAIKAYFYGYEEVEKRFGDEFDIFIKAIDNLSGDRDAQIYYTHIIYKWYAET